MSPAEATRLLEKEWDCDIADAFFWKVHAGEFDDAGCRRVEAILQGLDLAEEDRLDRRLVNRLWFIPTLLSWNRWRVEQGGDIRSFDAAVQRLTSLLVRPELLGVP